MLGSRVMSTELNPRPFAPRCRPPPALLPDPPERSIPPVPLVNTFTGENGAVSGWSGLRSPEDLTDRVRLRPHGPPSPIRAPVWSAVRRAVRGGERALGA